MTQGPAKYFFLLVLIAGAVYFNSLFNGFVWDDEFIIEKNPYIADLSNLSSLAKPDYFEKFGENSWRPVVTASYFADCAVWGKRPFGGHLTNLALHLATVALVFAWLSGLLKDRGAAFAAALLFGVHPAIGEAVNAISYREDLLAALFCIAALMAGRKTSRRPAALLAMLCFCLLGCLSKEAAFTVFAAIGAQDVFFSERGAAAALRENRLKYAALAGCAALAVLLRFGWMANPGEMKYVWPGGSFFTAMLTTAGIILNYVGLLIIPAKLSGVYAATPMTIASMGDWRPVCFLILLAGAVFAAVKCARKAPPVSFGVVLFFLALLPTANIAPIGNPMAERYLYLPSIGFLMAAVWAGRLAVERLAEKIGAAPAQKAGAAVLGAVVLLFSARAVVRNEVWKNHLVFWEKAVRTAPNSAGAHYNLASLYGESGHFEDAESQYLQAIAASQEHAGARNNLAWLYAKRGVKLEQALSHAKTAVELELNPGHYHTLATVYAKMGDAAGAREALAHIPDAPPFDELRRDILNQLGE